MLRASSALLGSIFCAALFIAFPADAALPPAGTSAAQCIKASFRGDASTYNPYLPGWRTGGGTLATGGPYNPNSYDAALQLGLARQYRCGYGRGAICHAVVQAPNGRALVVRINDNGPLVPGRVIDLNEKSMQYLSGGTMGRNSGVLRNVTVTLLCGIEGTALGPLEERDRIAWANRTFDAPYAHFPQATSPFAAASPFSNVASPVGYPSAPQYQQSPPQPAYQQVPYAPPAQTVQPAAFVSPTPYAPVSQPVSDTLLSGLSGAQTSLTAGTSDRAGDQRTVPAAASVIVQPRELSRGAQGLVSWTSVGMSAARPCRVSVVSGRKETLAGEGNEGTRPIKMSASSETGTLTFTLRCVSASGEPLERTASLIVR